MANLAVITARGGSKRIPRKNIKPFRGKPIIAYSIETALQSKLFDMVMVSTDDEEIAEIAKQYGAQVPFFRSKETSDDFTGTAAVIVEVVNQLSKEGRQFRYVCGIYPTAPFITAESLTQSFNLLHTNNFYSVFPVCAFSFPIFRAMRLCENQRVEMIWPENQQKRSQDLPAAYHDAGQFYWLDIPQFLQEQRLFSINSGTIVLDELYVQDIDNETDWKIAELKYNLLSTK
jgi:N-acylneuraminate cytidylyltransferase